MPKRPLSAYNLFFKAWRRYLLLQAQTTGRRKMGFAALGKQVGKTWQSLQPDERAWFDKLAAQDSQRYCREMQAYRRQEQKQQKQPQNDDKVPETKKVPQQDNIQEGEEDGDDDLVANEMEHDEDMEKNCSTRHPTRNAKPVSSLPRAVAFSTTTMRSDSQKNNHKTNNSVDVMKNSTTNKATTIITTTTSATTTSTSSCSLTMDTREGEEGKHVQQQFFPSENVTTHVVPSRKHDTTIHTDKEVDLEMVTNQIAVQRGHGIGDDADADDNTSMTSMSTIASESSLARDIRCVGKLKGLCVHVHLQCAGR